MRKSINPELPKDKTSQSPAVRRPFWKLIIASMAMLGVLGLLSNSVQAANVLNNPGFETGDPNGWG